MYPVQRIAFGLLGLFLLAGCGSSITDVTPRTAGASQVPVVTPFCDAVERSQSAAEPVSRWRVGQQVEDIAQVSDEVRSANQQVTALAPPELRADAERVTGVVDRQLRLLEDSGGDTTALARDPELARATNDPEYTAAARRLSDYVRRSC